MRGTERFDEHKMCWRCLRILFSEQQYQTNKVHPFPLNKQQYLPTEPPRALNPAPNAWLLRTLFLITPNVPVGGRVADTDVVVATRQHAAAVAVIPFMVLKRGVVCCEEELRLTSCVLLKRRVEPRRVTRGAFSRDYRILIAGM